MKQILLNVLLAGLVLGFSPKAVEAATESQRGNLRIHPNPATNLATIFFDNHENRSYTLSVTDLAGNRVIQRGGIHGNKYRFSVASLQKGLYLVELRSTDRYYNGKLYIK